MEREIKKRYNDLLDRSFNNDLQLFLFQKFIRKRNKGQLSIEEYADFNPTQDLVFHFISIHQLSKSSDLIFSTDLMVGQYDVFINEWFTHNQSQVKLLKAAYSNRFISLVDFNNFYDSTPKCCHYCQITEEKIEGLLREGKLLSKRLFSRGRSLEIDRKNPTQTYTKGNMTFCCYWCNNAKTDEFSSEEFAPIGKQVEAIWEKRLRKNS